MVGVLAAGAGGVTLTPLVSASVGFFAKTVAVGVCVNCLLHFPRGARILGVAMDSPSQDPLDLEIAAKAESVVLKEHELAAKERELEIERAELRALQRAASLRPVAKMNGARHSAGEPDTLRKRGGVGKVAGTISSQWRNTMGRLVETGNQPLPYDKWPDVAAAIGFDLKPKAARDWLHRGAGAKAGYIERVGNGYRVSQAAIEKFEFRTAEMPTGGSE